MPRTMGAWSVLEGGMIGGDPKLSPFLCPPSLFIHRSLSGLSLSSVQPESARDGREGKRHGTKRRVRHSCQGPLTGARGFWGF